MVEIGTTGIDSENDVAGGFPDPGRYHVVIHNAEEESDKVVVDFCILNGNKPNQEKKTLTERYYLTEKSLPRLIRLGVSCGFIPPNDLPKERDFAEAIGRQLIIEIEDSPYEKNGVMKQGRSVSYMGMWSLGNSEVADVPKDAEAMKMISGVATASPATPPATASPPAAATPPADTPAQPAGETKKGGWEDLV